MSNINTPGQAMGEVLATLLRHGYDYDNVEASHSVIEGEFVVTGYLVGKYEDGQVIRKALGSFNARIDRDGNEVIEAAAFGQIENGHMDPFVGIS